MLVSRETSSRVAALFPISQRDAAEQLLSTNCGAKLPGLEALSATQLERVQFAALKLSTGNYVELERAVKLAQTDWRDLLFQAGFGEDLEAHKHWVPFST